MHRTESNMKNSLLQKYLSLVTNIGGGIWLFFSVSGTMRSTITRSTKAGHITLRELIWTLGQQENERTSPH